jgi:general secretion pathway protein K
MKPCTSIRLPSQQRGIALITAVLMVALAMILAVNVGFNGYLDQRRSATNFALDQGFEVALGAEAWAADILREDKSSTNQQTDTDNLSEAWATPLPPLPIDGGEVEGRLEDMQGRFNLNSLVKMDDQGVLRRDPQAMKRFQRLLDIVELEPKWADVIADWIDADNETQGNGAEDGLYTSQTPPYRAANMPITRVSELLALVDFGLDRYRKLEPLVTVLPTNTTINLCTAPPEVLDALTDEREFTLARENVVELRKQGCYPTKDDFTNKLNEEERQELIQGNVVGNTSSYFRSTVWVTIGTTQLTLYSLLERGNGRAPRVRTLLRSFGTL